MHGTHIGVVQLHEATKSLKANVFPKPQNLTRTHPQSTSPHFSNLGFALLGMALTVEQHCVAKRTEFNLKIAQKTMYLKVPIQVLCAVKKVVTVVSVKETENWRRARKAWQIKLPQNC